MSYDLHFWTTGEPPSRDELLAYFGTRPHFQLQEDGAFYEREDTGVYFQFGLGGEPDEDEEDAPPGRSVPVHFNLNYNRPHTFGLEAEREVTAFVERFGLQVDDPQNEGMGRGPYSREGFLRGWNAGNVFGCSIPFLHGGQAPPQPTLPAELLERVWRWNDARSDYCRFLDEVEGRHAHAARISLLSLPGREGILTAAVWGGAMAIALPQVDVVIVVPRPGAELRFLAWTSVAPALQEAVVLPAGRRIAHDGAERELPLAHHHLEHAHPPARLVKALAAAPALQPTSKPSLLGFDQVLTREVVELARARVGRRT